VEAVERRHVRGAIKRVVSRQSQVGRKILAARRQHALERIEGYMAIDNNTKILAGNIKLLLLDCDGVLTDGRLYYSAGGEEMKVFDVKDGQGLVSWHAAGFSSGIISGRKSEIVELRAKELGIGFVHQGVEDKLAAFLAILSEAYITDPMEVAYVGDDIGDIPIMKKVGFPVAVADAVVEVKAAAAYVTEARGGRGAVREVIDFLLRAKNGLAS
jgi:3-deoxy-D-manno-octulosonate 8-phosphate phosphatase (KDO 8-P phosphatase)